MSVTTIPGLIRSALIANGITVPISDEGSTLWDAIEYPYITIADGISTVPELRGDGRAGAFRRLVQVDLWEAKAAPTGVLEEAVLDALNGVRLRPHADGGQASEILASSLYSSVRLAEGELRHTAITLVVRRVPQ